MKQIITKLINQGVFYTLSVLLFQSFITFYVIKYFDGIHGAIIGNIVLYLSVCCGYLLVAWINHNRSVNVKYWLFAAIVVCLLSTCMMQRKVLRLLLLGYALLGLGKGIYFCCLYLYEFEYVPPVERTRYIAKQNAWKSALEIVIPLLLGYVFSLVPNVTGGYLAVFLFSAVSLVLTALSIYNLPNYSIKPLHHTHYISILKKASRTSILYMGLVGLYVVVPFIGTLLEVQIIEKESWAGLFQGVTKGITFIILLLILRYSKLNHQIRHFMVLSFVMGLLLLLTPRWSGWVVLILYVLGRSLILSLLLTYEKPIRMKVMESLASENHTMLPVIIIQTMLDSATRILVLLASLGILHIWGVGALTYGIIVITAIGFILSALLAFYYLYQRAHNRPVV